MRNVKRLLVALVVLALAASVLIFVLENQQSVSVVFMGWVGPAVPLAIIAMLSLLLGLVMGPLIGLFIAIWRRARAPRSVA